MHMRDSLRPARAWEVRRCLHVPSLGHTADAMAVERAVLALDGVRDAVADLGRQRLVVCYDVTHLDYRTLIEVLEAAGFPPSTGRLGRWKGAWYQYLDDTTRENANAPPPSCCNRPPK